jgi:hypothetical protein
VKSKILVVQRSRGEVQKSDLTLGTEPGTNVLDFLPGQPRFLQKRLRLDPSRLGPFEGKPRGRPGCNRDSTEMLGFEVVHGFAFLRSKLPNQGWCLLKNTLRYNNKTLAEIWFRNFVPGSPTMRQ